MFSALDREPLGIRNTLGVISGSMQGTLQALLSGTRALRHPASLLSPAPSEPSVRMRCWVACRARTYRLPPITLQCVAATPGRLTIFTLLSGF